MHELVWGIIAIVEMQCAIPCSFIVALPTRDDPAAIVAQAQWRLQQDGPSCTLLEGVWLHLRQGFALTRSEYSSSVLRKAAAS